MTRIFIAAISWSSGTKGAGWPYGVNDCQLKQAALLWRYRTIGIRAVWPVYSGPAKNTNILSSDPIGKASEPAREADKRGLCFPIRFRDMPAGGTCARGIARVNPLYLTTTTQRLIGDKGLELSEAPRVEGCALRPSSLDPRANVRQIFDGNRTLRAFGLRNNPFGETVVHPGRKSALLTRQRSQATAASQRAKPLKLISEPTMPIAHVLDRLARMDFPIAIRSDVRDTEVNAKNVIHVDWFRSLNLGSGEQIPRAAHERQIGFAASRGEQLSLAFATHERDFLPPVECPDRDGSIRVGVGENTFVVGNRPQRSKRALCLARELVGIRDFGDTTHGELSGKAKRLSHRAVGQPMDRELAERFRSPCHLADVVTGSIRYLKRVTQGGGLFGRGQQFQLDRQPHIMIVSQKERLCKRRARQRGTQYRAALQFLCRLKSAVSLEIFL